MALDIGGRHWRLVFIVLGVAVCLGIASWVFRATLLRSAAEFLIVDETPEPGRYLVLLASEADQRPRKVAQLFHNGIGEIVLVSRVEKSGPERAGLVPDSTSLQVGMLQQYGVPARAIVVIGPKRGVTSTYEEAQNIKAYLAAQQHLGPFTVVTSALHTRRAQWILARVFDDPRIRPQFVAAPHSTFDATDWWQHERGLIYVNNEYLKFVRYLFKYWSLDEGK